VALAAFVHGLLSADTENVMTATIATIAVLGIILFGIIPFCPDWWRNLK
jgi:hypothetical protein